MDPNDLRDCVEEAIRRSDRADSLASLRGGQSSRAGVAENDPQRVARRTFSSFSSLSELTPQYANRRPLARSAGGATFIRAEAAMTLIERTFVDQLKLKHHTKTEGDSPRIGAASSACWSPSSSRTTFTSVMLPRNRLLKVFGGASRTKLSPQSVRWKLSPSSSSRRSGDERRRCLEIKVTAQNGRLFVSTGRGLAAERVPLSGAARGRFGGDVCAAARPRRARRGQVPR